MTFDTKKGNKFLKKFYLALVLIFLYAPIAILVLFSFNESKSRANWTGFTLKWYMELFKDPSIMEALKNTLLIAIISALSATLIGTMAAIGIEKMSNRQKNIALNINNLPIISPDIVTGISLMILYIFVINSFNVGNLGFFTLLLSHITFNIPFVLLSVLPKLRQMDKNIYEAALDLGAKPIVAFIKVVLPQIMPGVITGLLLAFTLSVDDFVISFFTTGSGVSNLSITVYSMAKRGINPKINALSTIMFVVVLALLYLINLRDSKPLRKKREDV